MSDLFSFTAQNKFEIWSVFAKDKKQRCWLVWPCVWDVACIMFHIKAIKMNQTLAAIPELPQAQAVAQGSAYPRQASPGLGNASAQAGARTWLQH